MLQVDSTNLYIILLVKQQNDWVGCKAREIISRLKITTLYTYVNYVVEVVCEYILVEGKAMSSIQMSIINVSQA